MPDFLLSEAAHAGRAIHEGWRVKKDGSKFWGSIVITALHDEEQNIIGYSKVTRDLTEAKKTDDKLKEYVHELQQQNEQLDQFAYAASHDLQEPLRKVKTFADLIEQAPEDTAAVQRYVKKILASADRMLALIKSVLAYSRLSKNVANKADTDLNDILANVCIDFELLIQETSAVITATSLPTIKANPQQINQLFSNLVGNALKFSSEAPVITISCDIVNNREVSKWPEYLPEDNYHEVVITDNGIGFEPQYAEQIFGLFQRLHHTDEYTGTGIGLGLCKKIMDNHDGFIYAEGRPGAGASFFLYFPKR